VSKAEAALAQSAIQNDLYRANTILEIAKQRGNEKEITQAQIAVWRIELEISDAQAKAARLEAEAMLLVAKAKRAELEASGGLTEAKKAELAVAEANVKAKQLEAEKYDLVADRMRKLSYDTNELKSSFLELSDSADSAGAAADRAAGSYDGLKNSISAAAKAKDGWSTDSDGKVIVSGVHDRISVAAALEAYGVDKARAWDQAGPAVGQGKPIDDFALRELAERLLSAQFQESKSKAAAQVQAENRGSQSPSVVGPGNIIKNTYAVDLRLNSGTKTVQVADQASANTLVSALTELAARS